MKMKQIVKIMRRKYNYNRPLVYLGNVLLIEGSVSNSDCDYYWPIHKLNKGNDYRVIAFNFHLKKGGRYIVVFRDEKLNPVEGIYIDVFEDVPSDTVFDIMTGFQVDLEE